MTDEVKQKLTDIIGFLKECHSEIIYILVDMSQLDLLILNNAVINSPLNLIGNVNSWVIHAQNIVGYPRILSKNIRITKQEFEVSDCSICYETNKYNNSCLTGCNHEFCIDCMTSLCKTRISKPNIPCPMCRDDIKKLNFNQDVVGSNHIILLSLI
jgi:hypothetical protein